jgi:chromosome segregation ATPase
MKDEQLLIRLNSRTKEAIEDFADEYEYNQSEAARKIMKGRLAAEGYLEGATVVDGGMSEGVDQQIEELDGEIRETQDEIETTQQEVRTTLSEIEELKSSIKAVGPAIGLALIWIGVQTSVGIPGGTLAVTVSGFAVLLIMLYQYYEVMLNE